GLKISRVRAAIHIDGAIRVRATDVEDVKTTKRFHFDKLHTVRREELTSSAGSFASRMRFKLMLLTIVIQSLCPRLERNLLYRSDRVEDAEYRGPHTFLSWGCALKQHATISIFRGRSSRRQVGVGWLSQRRAHG